jgi:predicted hydrocarbon binding protein
MEVELGAFSTESLLASAGLPNSLPDDSLERVYPFEHLGALNRALFEMYGPQGTRGLSLAVGRAWFDALASFGAFAAFADPTFQGLPTTTRLGIGLKVLAEVLTRLSDQQTQVDTHTPIPHLLVENSPFIFPDANAPVCFLLAGLTQGCLSAASGGLIVAVREIECRGEGGARCVFAVGHTHG